MYKDTTKNQVFIVHLAKIHLFVILSFGLLTSLFFILSNIDLYISSEFYNFTTKIWQGNQNNWERWVYVLGVLPQVLLLDFVQLFFLYLFGIYRSILYYSLNLVIVKISLALSIATPIIFVSTIFYRDFFIINFPRLQKIKFPCLNLWVSFFYLFFGKLCKTIFSKKKTARQNNYFWCRRDRRKTFTTY